MTLKPYDCTKISEETSCTSQEGCKWTGTTKNTGKCDCNTDKMFAHIDDDDLCYKCDDETVQLDSKTKKCICKDETHILVPYEDSVFCLDVSSDCMSGTYKKNDECFACQDGYYSSEFGATKCTPCSRDTPVSNVRRNGCQTAVDCQNNPNAHLTSRNQCACDDGYRPVVGNICAACPEGSVSDIWGLFCQTTEDCLGIQNTGLEAKKCHCKPGYRPNPANYNPKTHHSHYQCVLGSGASSGTVIVVLLLVIAVLVTVIQATLVTVRARKTKAANEAEAFTIAHL